MFIYQPGDWIWMGDDCHGKSSFISSFISQLLFQFSKTCLKSFKLHYTEHAPPLLPSWLLSSRTSQLPSLRLWSLSPVLLDPTRVWPECPLECFAIVAPPVQWMTTCYPSVPAHRRRCYSINRIYFLSDNPPFPSLLIHWIKFHCFAFAATQRSFQLSIVGTITMHKTLI